MERHVEDVKAINPALDCCNNGGMIAHKYHTEYILNEGIDGCIYFSPVLVIDD